MNTVASFMNHSTLFSELSIIHCLPHCIAGWFFVFFFSFAFVKQEIQLSENWGHMRKQWGMPEWGQGKKFFLFFSFPHLLPHCFHTWPWFSLCKSVSLTLQNTTKKHPKKTRIHPPDLCYKIISVLKYSLLHKV